MIVPVHNLFTSSRMISRSPVVASQIKPAMWMINHDDAERWMVKVGDKLTLSQHGAEITLPVEVVDYLADGCIGYPDGAVPLMVGIPTTVKKQIRTRLSMCLTIKRACRDWQVSSVRISLHQRQGLITHRLR